MYESTISQKATDLAQEVENLMHTNRIPAKVTVIPKVNINDVTEMMLHINELGSYVHPSVSIDHILTDLGTGNVSLSVAAEEIMNRYQRSIKNLPEEPSFVKEDVLPNLRVAVVNTEANREFLKKHPHVNVQDLSLIAIYQISDEGHIKVTNTFCSELELTPDEVMDAAIKCTAKQPFKIVSMSEQLHAMMGDDELLEEMIMDNQVPQMYVLTNETGFLGAGAFFANEEIKRSVMERFNEPVVIIPSSTHELLAIPVSQISSFREIDEMIQSINASEVAAEDYLSSHCYLLKEDLSITMPTMAEELAMKSTETCSVSIRI